MTARICAFCEHEIPVDWWTCFYCWGKLMIPKSQFKRAVTRFESATRRLKCVRAVDRKERASILFEFREAKRELLQLGNLLITGEIPDKAFDPAVTKYSEVSSLSRRIQTGMVSYGEPKTSGGAGPR